MAGNTFKGWGGGLLGGNGLTGLVRKSELIGDIYEESGEIIPQGDVRGVYSKNPATTPKYHTGNKDVTREYMARLFIPIGDAAREPFINALPPRARSLAEQLVVSDWTRLPTSNVNRGSSGGFGYIDFLLQSANEQYNEKLQIADAVGDNYVGYYLGHQPPVFQYAGTLLNSYQDNWRTAFTILYNDILRGTMLARKKLVVVLAYDDVMVTGSLNNLSQLLTANFELMASFSFSMLVKRYDVNTRSPEVHLRPTPLASYPYNIVPSKFASVAIPGVTKSLWSADTAVYTTSQRKKDSETGATIGGVPDMKVIDPVPDPEKEYIWNTVYGAAVEKYIVVPEGTITEQPSDTLDVGMF